MWIDLFNKFKENLHNFFKKLILNDKIKKIIIKQKNKRERRTM
jgi:hypothetical protein